MTYQKKLPLAYLTEREAIEINSATKAFIPLCLPWTYTGSGIVRGCTSEDIDILVYDPDDHVSRTLPTNYIEGGSLPHPSSKFKSFKSPIDCSKHSKVLYGKPPTGYLLRQVNLIVAKDERFFTDFYSATQILYKAQLKEKHHRVELFQYMQNERPMNPERFAKLSSGDVEGLDEVFGVPF